MTSNANLLNANYNPPARAAGAILRVGNDAAFIDNAKLIAREPERPSFDLTRFTPSALKNEQELTLYKPENANAKSALPLQPVQTQLAPGTPRFTINPSAFGSLVYEPQELNAISVFKQIQTNGETRQNQFRQIDTYT